MTSLLTKILGADKAYDALMVKVNALFDWRHTLDYVVKTASYTATSTDQLAIIDTSGGAVVATLPAVASSANVRLFFFLKDVTNAFTLDGNASETINGDTTAVFQTKYVFISIFCDGAAWYVETTPLRALKARIKTITSSYSVLPEDEVVLTNQSSGTVVTTLPLAASMPGRTVLVKNIGSGGTSGIAPTSPDTIDGSGSTVAINTRYQARAFLSDGALWYIAAAFG